LPYRCFLTVATTSATTVAGGRATMTASLPWTDKGILGGGARSEKEKVVGGAGAGQGRLTVGLLATLVLLTLSYHVEVLEPHGASLRLAGLLVFLLAVLASSWELLGRQYAKPLLVCLGFMVVGPALIALNKHVMEECDFPFPLTLSSLGLLTSSLVAQFAVRLGFAELRPKTVDAVRGWDYLRIVVPIALTRCLALSLGNAVYLHLSLGFIQMLKAFTPAMVLVAMYSAGVETPQRPSIACVAVIVFGTLVEVHGELHASVLGLAMMMGSSIGEAFSTVMNQKLMQNLCFSEVEAMYYIAGTSVFLLALPTVALEWGDLFARERYMVFWEYPLHMLGACVLGLGVNFITMFAINLTSSMTVKVLNTFRCIGLVFLGVLFYGETRSSRQLCGYGISLVGFVGYNYFQLKRDKAKAVEHWVEMRLAGVLGCRCRRAPPREDDEAASKEKVVEEFLSVKEKLAIAKSPSPSPR